MTKINRFSMIFETIMMNDRKKTGAMEMPHVLSGMHSGDVSIVSYMILFQSSPVDIEKRSEKLIWKLVKFLNSSMTSPSYTSKNMVLPSTALMKKMSISRMKTLNRESTDIMIVLRRAWRPLALPARRRTRLTRKTLRTLAS